MILHIVVDDKFIDMAYSMFEKVSPRNNKFILVTNDDATLKYIKTTPVIKISSEEFMSRAFIDGLQKYEFVVFHWLDGCKIQFIKNIPQDVKTLWIGWGADYYYLINRNLLLPKTRRFRFSVEIKQALKHGISASLKVMRSYFLNVYADCNETKDIINKINFFAPVLKEDYDLVANSIVDFKPNFIDWNYGTLEDNFARGEDKVSGNNILVGNSATYENNHLEAFEILDKMNLGERKIISPLSYGGGNEIYRERIIRQGRKKFGKNFMPLVEFIQIDEYNKIISSCSVVIMNHIRQQAVGNIISMMYFGAKIFLRKENPVFEFFKKNNAIIYTIDELAEEINKPLSKNELEYNRSILRKYWSRDVLIKKTIALIDDINSSKNEQNKLH